MEGSGLSAGDILALTKGSDGTFGQNWIWIIGLLIIAGIFGGGFGGFGFGNNGSALTQAELQAGLYNQTTDRNLSDIRDAIAGVNASVLTTACNTDKEIMQNRYDNQLAIANSNSMMQNCCCEIKTAIHAEGEATRALITENTIQALRDEVAGYRETLSNANQSQNLLNAIGTWRANPPYPYYGAYPYGTTIA